MEMEEQIEIREINALWDRKEKKWYYCFKGLLDLFFDSDNSTENLRILEKGKKSLIKEIENVAVFKEVRSNGVLSEKAFIDVETSIRLIMFIDTPRAAYFKNYFVNFGLAKFYELVGGAKGKKIAKSFNLLQTKTEDDALLDSLLDKRYLFSLNSLLNSEIKRKIGKFEIVEVEEIIKEKKKIVTQRPPKKKLPTKKNKPKQKVHQSFDLDGFPIKRNTKKSNSQIDSEKNLTENSKRTVKVHYVTRKGLARLKKKGRI
jgi:hypothetical protein